MKKPLVLLLVVLGGLLLATDTAAAHGSKYKYKFKFKYQHGPTHVTHVTPHCGLVVAPAPVVVAPAWHYVHRRVFVPAVTQNLVVGYQPCGTPVVRSFVVTPACYKMARYKQFSTGASVFVGYVG